MKLKEVAEITIERGVERPLTRRSRQSGWYALFEQMHISDSFAQSFTSEQEAKRIQQKIMQAKRNYRLTYNASFSGECRILYNSKEVRFWRDS